MEPATRTGGAAFACALCACVGTAILAPALGAQPPRARPRAAVISDPADKLGGLADLLFAAFSEGGRVDLVERAELKKALAEQELQLVFGAAGGAARRRLGAVLRAGYLVLLRATGSGATRGVELVIAETRHGYRLDRHMWPWDSARAAAIAKGASARVHAVLDRFPGGVTLAVAIPDFLSGNLTHRFDHLQSAYARIAELEVLRRPGCVAVELEEAKAIGDELAASEGDGKVERPQAFYVLGEFRHENGEPESAASITMRLRRNRQTVVACSADDLKPADAAAFVRTTASQMVASLLKDGSRDLPRPNVAEEVRTLGTRARLFRSTGEFEKAIALCEAALLLHPRHHESREAILELCNRILSVSVQGRSARDRSAKESRRRVVDDWRRRLRHARRGYEHLGVLVRTKRFDSFRELRARVEELWQPMNRMRRKIWGKYLFIAGPDEEYEQVKRAHHDFLLRDLPRTWRAQGWPDAGERPLYYGAGWCRLTHEFDHPWKSGTPTKADLDFRLRLVREVLADKPGSTTRLLFLVRISRDTPYKLKRAGQDAFERYDRDFNRFLDQLLVSGSPDVRAAARYGRVAWNLHAHSTLSDAEFAEAKRAIEQCRDSNGRRTLLQNLRSMRAYHERAPTRPRPSPRHVTLPPSRARDPVRYRPVKIELRSDKGQGDLLTHKALVRCSRGMDVLWDAHSVYAMVKRGVAEEVFTDPKMHITDLRWDGARLWAATRQGRLLAIDPGLRKVRPVGSREGLPESGLGMVVCPLAPGRVCAVGSFPPHGRAWCAIVTANGKVNVFHEARDTPKDDEHVSPSVAFTPTWAVPVPSSADPKRVERVLVGRSAGAQYPYHAIDSRLLVIDPARLTVGLTPLPLPCSAPGIQANGIVLHGDTLIWSIRVGDRLYAFDMAKGTTTYLHRSMGSRRQTGELVAWRGRLLAPCMDGKWLEVDPSTLAERALAPVRAPARFSHEMCHYRSWHYGILAWGMYTVHGFFEVSVLDGAKER